MSLNVVSLLQETESSKDCISRKSLSAFEVAYQHELMNACKHLHKAVLIRGGLFCAISVVIIEGCRVRMRQGRYRVRGQSSAIRRQWTRRMQVQTEAPASGLSLTRCSTACLDSLHIGHSAHGGAKSCLSSLQVVAWLNAAAIGSATLVLIVIVS